MANVILETVTIKCDIIAGKDHIRTDPSMPRIDTGPTRTAGDNPQVKWICQLDGADYDTFAIHFGKHVPTRKIRGRCHAAPGEVVMDLVVGGTGKAPKVYKYLVAVGLSTGEILTTDPEIIVW